MFLPEKTNFSNEKASYTYPKNNRFFQRKNFLYFRSPQNDFPNKIIPYTCLKISSFPNQNKLLQFIEKTILQTKNYCTCLENYLKNYFMLYTVLIIVKQFFLLFLNISFLYSTILHFSSSWKFLCHSCSYCCFFLFLLLKDFVIFHETFSYFSFFVLFFVLLSWWYFPDEYSNSFIYVKKIC